MWVSIVQEFYLGEPAVLVAADASGIEELELALEQASRDSERRLGSQLHTFVVGGPGEVLEVKDDKVIWRISEAKRDEILQKLHAIRASPHPSHHYVDITQPTTTLVLSRDEYPELSG